MPSGFSPPGTKQVDYKIHSKNKQYPREPSKRRDRALMAEYENVN